MGLFIKDGGIFLFWPSDTFDAGIKINIAHLPNGQGPLEISLV